MKNYPTVWQKKVLWSALTGVAMTFIGALAFFLILAAKRALGVLQPILTPVAVAGVLAYLLHPLVDKLVARHVTRTKAVLYVFTPVLLSLVLISVLVLPNIYEQSVGFAKKVPGLVIEGRGKVDVIVKQCQVRYANNPFVQDTIQQVTDWTQKQLPELPLKAWNFVTGGVQGFLGAFGVLLGMLLIPIYLFFFLVNSEPISRRWSDYLPLRASPFKDEVVSCLNEINNYLIAFFRGQILVTLIDGALLAIVLLFMGLDFAILIGLGVAVLQIVPYLGVIVCWIPAVLIAAVQFHDWQHPFWVTVAFFVVTNLDSLFIAPRIIGGSVGLHPMTIIVSVFVWSLIIGGLLGALLAVPLTATLKVLLRRYVWVRRFRGNSSTVTVTQGNPPLTPELQEPTAP